MREPEPQPEPKDEAQAELALALDPVGEKSAAPVVAAPAAVAKDEDFHESLTLAFDATLADGLAERSAAAEKEIASEPAAPAPSFTSEPVALRAPEPAPAAIETPVRAEPQAAIEPPPAPAYVAPVAAAPKIEPKPESETPNRALSRSEMMIARAARQSARPARGRRRQPRKPWRQRGPRSSSCARPICRRILATSMVTGPHEEWPALPVAADFDAEQVAEHWPNSMLLTCGTAIGAGTHGSFSSVLRIGRQPADTAGRRPQLHLDDHGMDPDHRRRGGACRHTGAGHEVFPTPDGTHAYKIVPCR